MCEGLKKIIENEKNALQKIIDSKNDVIAEKYYHNRNPR